MKEKTHSTHKSVQKFACICSWSEQLYITSESQALCRICSKKKEENKITRTTNRIAALQSIPTLPFDVVNIIRLLKQHMQALNDTWTHVFCYTIIIHY